MTLFADALLRRRALAVALGVGAFLLAAGGASAEPKVLAKIDGVPITEEDVNDALEDIGPGLPQKLDGPARQQYALDYLIDMKLVAKKAAEDKMDSGPAFARRMAYYHDKLAMEALLTDVAAKAATDDAEHKAYDEAAKANPPVPEIHARHILLPTEDEAKAALARIKKGEDFAKVATELSKDPGSEGGDLGWFTKDKMVPEFADAAFKMEPGQVSDPVKSQFGWHIIKVEEKRMKTFPAFEQVKDQAARYVVQKAQSDLIVKLHEGVKIERTDAAPAKPADAAAPVDGAKPADKPADAK
ncbi:MAG TPA: peptidylprolyl isomerase [Roseiarcus sp.]|jgi:peptidyl-prolyl cis-trans isomerase C